MCDAGCDAGPLSSIVWANFLASGWFVQLAHSCFFPVTFFPTCPLFLFFLSLYSYCYPNELLPFFLFLFSPLVHCYFLSCYFFSYLSTVTFFPVTFFPVTFFPTWNCYFLSCYLFSCYFLSVQYNTWCNMHENNTPTKESRPCEYCSLGCTTQPSHTRHFGRRHFQIAFSWMKMIEFRFKFHLIMLPGVQLTISQHWFR